MAQPDGVSVVLPCYNEADSVGQCVTEVLDTLKAAGISGEVVVVDNGSTDRSADVAGEAGARVIHEQRQGYGSALLAGIEAAHGPTVVMADADWTYDFRRLPEMLEPIAAGRADLVMGSRLSAATRANMPLLHRYLGTPVLSSLVRMASAGVQVGDSQSGYRAFRKDVIQGLGLTCQGMEFASEMLIHAGRRGLRIEEIHTGYRERIGDSKLDAVSDGVRHLKLIFLLAPQLLLVAPGLALLALGLVFTIIGLLSPVGLEIGSIRWQPIFFSTIALTLGMQLALVGVVLSERATLGGTASNQRFAFAGHHSFPAWCFRLGAAMGLAGAVLDAFLFAYNSSGGSRLGNGLGIAAAGQSLLIDGGFLISAGLVLRTLHWADRRAGPAAPSGNAQEPEASLPTPPSGSRSGG